MKKIERLRKLVDTICNSFGHTITWGEIKISFGKETRQGTCITCELPVRITTTFPGTLPNLSGGALITKCEGIDGVV